MSTGEKVKVPQSIGSNLIVDRDSRQPYSFYRAIGKYESNPREVDFSHSPQLHLHACRTHVVSLVDAYAE